MSARLSINHAYFHEALSGEFYAMTDPERNKGTLGYLLMETYEYGAVANLDSSNE